MESRLQQNSDLLEYRPASFACTPLMSAVINQHELCVTFLLNQGADVHATLKTVTRTQNSVNFMVLNIIVCASFISVEDKNIKKRIIKRVLEHGGDVNNTFYPNNHEISTLEYLIADKLLEIH